MTTNLIYQISANQTLEKAFVWLYNSRKNAHYNSDIWHLRFHWQTLKPQIQQALLNNRYRFAPCKAMQVNGESVGLWSARDALILKAVSLVLAEAKT